MGGIRAESRLSGLAAVAATLDSGANGAGSALSWAVAAGAVTCTADPLWVAAAVVVVVLLAAAADPDPPDPDPLLPELPVPLPLDPPLVGAGVGSATAIVPPDFGVAVAVGEAVAVGFGVDVGLAVGDGDGDGQALAFPWQPLAASAGDVPASNRTAATVAIRLPAQAARRPLRKRRGMVRLESFGVIDGVQCCLRRKS